MRHEGKVLIYHNYKYHLAKLDMVAKLLNENLMNKSIDDITILL